MLNLTDLKEEFDQNVEKSNNDIIEESEVDIKSNVESLELYSDEYPFSLSMRIKDFPTEKAMNKFIKNCEILVRRSIEYKEWRSYLIDVLGVNKCAITDELNSEVTVEVHHHIPSLFLIVKAIVNKYIQEEKEFSTFDIALEVIKLHYENRIGYITLLKSIHEKFHNGFLQIPISLIKGNYKYFIENYLDYLDEEDKEIIMERLSITKTDVSWTRDNYKAVVND